MGRKLRYVPQSRTLVSITNRTIQGRLYKCRLYNSPLSDYERPPRQGINARATLQPKSRVNPAPGGAALTLEPASAGFSFPRSPGIYATLLYTSRL